jgi:uncharacterized protein
MNAAVGMPCPVCKVALVMSDRQGVEIDYCPQCRGVWLDRGELDKIIERNATEQVTAAPRQAAQPSQGQYIPQDFSHHPQGYAHGYPYKKRKKSFLEELFD